MSIVLLIEYTDRNFVDYSSNIKLLDILKNRILIKENYNIREFVYTKSSDIALKTKDFHNLESEITFESNDIAIFLLTNAEPLIDNDLLNNCFEIIGDYEEVKFDGFIPGTYPQRVISTDYVKRIKGNSVSIKQVCELPISKKKYTMKSELFEKWNINLRVGRYKRGNIIKAILTKNPNISMMNIEQILEELQKSEMFSTILSYGKQVPLRKTDICEFCGSKNLTPLKILHSQPIIGFLPINGGWYWECNNCGLIFLNPRIEDNYLDELYDEEYYRLGLLDTPLTNSNSWRSAMDIGRQMEKGTLLDIGGGFGGFCKYFGEKNPKFDITMIEISEELVANARSKGINSILGKFTEIDFAGRKFDIITIWEVVEHITLSNFSKILDKAFSILNENGVFIFSTPNYDSFDSRVFDFYVSFIPHHLYCFTIDWLKKFILKESQFKSISFITSEEYIKNRTDWVQYWSEFSNNNHLRYLASFFLEMDRKSPNLYHELIEYIYDNSGSQIIGVLRKKE